MRKLVLAALVMIAALVPASPAAAAQPDVLKCIVLYDGDPIGLVGCVA